jgi:hypothetical protein
MTWPTRAFMSSTRLPNGGRLARGCAFLFAGLLVYVAGPHAWANYADLPIGHLEITPGEDGKINVKARCVAAQELLAQLAPLMNKPIAGRENVHGLVTVYLADEYREPVFWFWRMTSTLALDVAEEAGVWRITIPPEPQSAPVKPPDLSRLVTPDHRAYASKFPANVGGSRGRVPLRIVFPAGCLLVPGLS